MFNTLRKLIRNYFGFSRVETNGFLVLFPLMIVMLFVPGIYTSMFSREYNPYEEDLPLLDSLMAVWNDVAEVKKATFPEETKRIVRLSSFNPNSVKIEEMEQLGIPDFLCRRIDNYRKKGGQFRLKKDLARIYDFPDSLYRVLEQYIDLSDEHLKPEIVRSDKADIAAITNTEVKAVAAKYERAYKPRPVIKVDLSIADTIALKKLRGIGPSFSRRIVKYRNLLGGFADTSQLKEVYGLSDSLYLSLSDHVYVSRPDSLKKIAVNIANFKELSSHPYISYKAAREILQLKSTRGKFRSLQDLMLVKEMDSVKLRKLEPYLVF